MRIARATGEQLDDWAALRIALWAWDTIADHRAQAEALYLSGDPHRLALVAIDDIGALAGFAEAALRRDYVEGCDTSPVVFLEGIYVRPEARHLGIARLLAEAVAAWGRDAGCTEYASNALLGDTESHAFHAAIGFVETERVVCFRKDL